MNPTLAMLIVLAADTGARRGELCALRWRHLDDEAGTVRIEAAIGETNVVYEKDTKTHQHRTVTLSSFAVDWLLDHRNRHAKACALCGFELSRRRLRARTRTRRARRRCTRRTRRRAFSRLRDRMELPTWVHLHGLRHLQVTQLLDAGVPLRSVSGRVGHRNPSTTTNIYAHWIQESDARSAEVVEDRIWRRQLMVRDDRQLKCLVLLQATIAWSTPLGQAAVRSHTSPGVCGSIARAREVERPGIRRLRSSGELWQHRAMEPEDLLDGHSSCRVRLQEGSVVPGRPRAVRGPDHEEPDRIPAKREALPTSGCLASTWRTPTLRSCSQSHWGATFDRSGSRRSCILPRATGCLTAWSFTGQGEMRRRGHRAGCERPRSTPPDHR